MKLEPQRDICHRQINTGTLKYNLNSEQRGIRIHLFNEREQWSIVRE